MSALEAGAGAEGGFGECCLLVSSCIAKTYFLRSAAVTVATLARAWEAASAGVYPIASGGETLLPACLTLAAVYAFLHGGRGWFAAAILAFAAALFAKEQAIVVPLLFLAADWLRLSPDSPGGKVAGTLRAPSVTADETRSAQLRTIRGACVRLWRAARRVCLLPRDPMAWIRRYAPVAGVLAVYFLIRWRLFQGAEYEWAVLREPFGPLLSLAYAVQTLFVPFVELVYEPPTPVWLSVGRLVIAAVASVLLLTAAFRRPSGPAGSPAPSRQSVNRQSTSEDACGTAERKENVLACLPARSILFWSGWFVLTLLPTANLVKQQAAFDERYVFLASLAMIAVAAAVTSSAWDNSGVRRAAAPLWLAAILVCATITWHRAGYFKDELAFFGQWVKTDPASLDARVNLGLALEEVGRLEEAVAQFRAALDIDPLYVGAQINLGNALAAQGRMDEAIDWYQQALSNPTRHPHRAEIHLNLAGGLLSQGKTDEAIDHYSSALEWNSQLIDARVMLATAA